MRETLRLVVLSCLLGGCSSVTVLTEPSPVAAARDAAKDATKNWAAYPRVTAGMLIDEYGPPDSIEAGRLVWYEKGAYKRTEVWNLTASPEILQQTVSYRVPGAKQESLTLFSPNISVTGGGEELSARFSTEDENRLALNLAVDVIQDRADPFEAQRTYARTVALLHAGKTSPLTQSLLFPPQP